MTTIQKMYRTNASIRKYLEGLGYKDITWFPMTRFQKDVYLNNLPFDGIALSPHHKITLIQAKSNKKPTKQEITDFKELGDKYLCEALWITKFDGGDIEIWPQNSI